MNKEQGAGITIASGWHHDSRALSRSAPGRSDQLLALRRSLLLVPKRSQPLGVGCGMMMISREVIKTMLEKMPELNDTGGDYLMEAVASEVPLTPLIRAFDKSSLPSLDAMRR